MHDINGLLAIIANLALTLSLIVAVIFGIAQVRVAARDRRERLTLETLRNFQTREFAELMMQINALEIPADRKGLLALPADAQIMLMQYAQQMESLGILVAERLVNIELVDKILGSYVTTTWEKYKPMFLDIRVTLPDPFLGEYFQWLAEQIDERMQKFPRKPFYQDGVYPRQPRHQRR